MSWCFIFLSFCIIRASHRKTICPPYICLKRDNRYKMESFVLSPISPNLDLIPNPITISASPRNVKVSTTEVCNPKTPFITHKKVNLPGTIYFMLETSFPTPSAYKSLFFCTALRSSLLSVRWVAVRFVNWWIKPIKLEPQIYSVDFF